MLLVDAAWTGVRTAGCPWDSPIRRRMRACASPKPSWPQATGESRRGSSPPLRRWPTGSERPLWPRSSPMYPAAAELGQAVRQPLMA